MFATSRYVVEVVTERGATEDGGQVAESKKTTEKEKTEEERGNQEIHYRHIPQYFGMIPLLANHIGNVLTETAEQYSVLDCRGPRLQAWNRLPGT